MRVPVNSNGSTKEWHTGASTSSLSKAFGSVLEVGLRKRTSGTVEVLTPEPVREGSAATPGDTSVTWTVRATTETDAEPDADIEFSMGLRSEGKSARSPDDYTTFSTTLRFRGTDTWTRTDTGGGDYRYVAEKTGEITIVDDASVEANETFEVVLA